MGLENTSNFYIDGSPKNFDIHHVQDFMSREKPQAIDWTNFDVEIRWSDETNVIILRSILFFHSEQKGITLGKLREFFSDKSVKLLEKDGFIKLDITDRLTK